jgi:hypothetical protein
MANKLSQLRQLNGDFARAYKYNFSFFAQKNATSLAAILGQYGSTNGDIGALMSTACVSVVLPNVGSQEIPVEVGNHTLRLPGRKDTSGTISPEFILSGNYVLYKFLRAWNGLATSHSDDTQVASYKLLADVLISSKDVEDTVQKKIKLVNLWCRNCPEINYSDETNDVIRFSPELAYEYAVDAD